MPYNTIGRHVFPWMVPNSILPGEEIVNRLVPKTLRIHPVIRHFGQCGAHHLVIGGIGHAVPLVRCGQYAHFSTMSSTAKGR